MVLALVFDFGYGFVLKLVAVSLSLDGGLDNWLRGAAMCMPMDLDGILMPANGSGLGEAIRQGQKDQDVAPHGKYRYRIVMWMKN